MGELAPLYWFVLCVDDGEVHIMRDGDSSTLCGRVPPGRGSYPAALHTREEAQAYGECKRCLAALRQRICTTPKHFTTSQWARWRGRVRQKVAPGQTLRDLVLAMQKDWPSVSADPVEQILRGYHAHLGIRLEGKGLEAKIVKDEPDV